MNNCVQRRELCLKALCVLLLIVSIPVNIFSFSAPEKKRFSKSEYVKQMTEPLGGISVYGEKINFPKLAIQAGLDGNVIARIFINANGDVDTVYIDKSAGSVFDELVEKALKDIKFKPVVQDGNAVKAQFTIDFQFHIKDN
jgi:TonB family protein